MMILLKKTFEKVYIKIHSAELSITDTFKFRKVCAYVRFEM